MNFTGTHVKFMRELEDVTVTSGEQTTFECELSKAGQIMTWVKDNETLYADDSIDIQSVGRTHRLVIKQTNSQDVGKYSAVCDNLCTTAALSVLGKSTVSSFAGTTSSSAVGERLRDALCPSAIGFNSVIPRAQSFVIVT